MENCFIKEIFISFGEDLFEKYDDVKGCIGDIWVFLLIEGIRFMYVFILIIFVVFWYS